MGVRIIGRPDILHFVYAAAFGTSFHRALTRHLNAAVRTSFSTESPKKVEALGICGATIVERKRI
jgi:hypothetical protein